MPLILDNPNPQAVMLGRQHLRKVMLGGEVVWQKHRPQPPEHDVTLETLEHRKVKLTAANQNGKLFFPMFFQDRLRTDYQVYLDRLTFIGDAVLSLQTIDAMLIADVVEKDMHFPMFFFEEKPENFDYRQRCTFIANVPPVYELGLETLGDQPLSEDGKQQGVKLTADIQNGNMYFPMFLFDEKPDDFDYRQKCTFIANKERS